MKFPYAIVENMDENLCEKWNRCYSGLNDKYANRNRKEDEGIWRRTQMFGTRHESGWKKITDMRRRMVHYLHNYDVIKDDRNGYYNLCMVDTYVWIHLTFPENEINDYFNQIIQGLAIGNWKRFYFDEQECEFRKGDLIYKIWRKSYEKEDLEMKRVFPNFYKVLEVCIYTENRKNNCKEKEKAWGVLNNGPRIRDTNGRFEELYSSKDLKNYLPAHIELGCGPSIELGIPPLNFLHDVYYVTDKETNKFILGPEKDKLAYEIAANTEKMYELFSIMYKKCFLAVPNSKFYKCLQKMFERGDFLDPLYTNNFDGVPIQLGLDEFFLRRYEQENLIPKVFFNKNAKSLISIGCHADRRKIQEAARQAGLKVIHIDPEGYYRNDGSFISYPLEAKKDGDLFFKADCSKALSELLKCLEYAEK